MNVLVLGSSNTDLVIRVPRLPLPGETVLGGTFFQAAGGKGANQAVAAARAGGQVSFLASVGDDEFGSRALAGFRAEGIDTTYVRQIAGAGSGVALIMVDERGENCISVASGANSLLRADDVDRVPDAIFAGSKVFLACLESPLGAVRRGLERARAGGAITILNPAPALPLAELVGLLPLVDLITPNEHEASSLSAIPVASPDSAIAAARQLQTLGCRWVIVTLGAAGCVVVEQKASPIAPPAVQAVDTTAAGDGFNGALAVALAEGIPLLAAAKWASAAAGISVTRVGAQPSLATRCEIEAALRNSPS